MISLDLKKIARDSLARARPRMRQVALHLRHGCKRLQVRTKLRLAVAVLAAGLVVSLGIGWAWMQQRQARTKTQVRAADALAALDRDDLREARRLAAAVREEAAEASALAASALVLGHVFFQDAEGRRHPGEQKVMYLLAARYLEEALQRGLPPDRLGGAQELLARSLIAARQFHRAEAALRQALASNSPHATELKRFLAQVLLADEHGRMREAAELLGEYIADPAVAAEARHAARLDQGRLFIQLGEAESCLRAVEAIPEGTAESLAARLLQIRCLLGLDGDARPPAQLQADVRRAQQLLAPLTRDEQAGQAVRRQAEYLTGLAHGKLGETPAALSAFQSVVRWQFNSDEGLASLFEVAELQFREGDTEAALASYARLLDEDYRDRLRHCTWVPWPHLQDRLRETFKGLRKSAPDQGLVLLQAARTVLPEPEVVESRAELEFELAARAARAAERATGTAREALCVEARQLAQDAGRDFQRLAELRRGARTYPDLLWRSAEGYRLGEAHAQAAAVLLRYLETQPRRAQLPAVVALSDSYLAQGETQAALRWLSPCLLDYPQHPLLYQVRLLAARARLEEGQIEEAKQLLLANLDDADLAPSSLEWRSALFALARILYREGAEAEIRSRQAGVDSDDPATRKAGLKELAQACALWQQAAARLDEAVRRYPDDQEALEARYLLAEAHRQLAKLPRKRLPLVPVESSKVAVRRQMMAELATALEGYLELQSLLEVRHEHQGLTDLERAMWRNSSFAAADVLAHLERYEDALRSYAAFANRFQTEPESIEAYVQMAACYRRLERWSEARQTIQQARIMLQRIPEDAGFSAASRYSRAEWDQVLDWLSRLYAA